MIGSVNSSSLSQIYRTQSNEFSALSAKIASGKEIYKPSDDFSGYTRAAGIMTKIGSYKDINKNLVELREPTQLASDAGNGILEDLTKMKDLAKQYTIADAAKQATLTTEFTALTAKITKTIANTEYGSKDVVANGTLSEVAINPDTPATKLTVAFVTADDIVVPASLDITDETTIDDEITKATSYTVKAESFLSQIDRQIEMNENLIASKEDTYSALTDLDEVKSLAQATNLQVRQQASIAMIAQANNMAGSVARLYQ